MILLQKWNYETNKYEPFESPANDTFIWTSALDQPVDCANCGTTHRFGDMYTSRTIHTDTGFGYPVCEVCYEAETRTERGIKK